MNKADKILEDVNITHKQLELIQEQLSAEFDTDHYQGHKLRVYIVRDSVHIGAGSNLRRGEALRLGYWLIGMLEPIPE